MLFQMLTGVLLYQGNSMAQLMHKITNEPVPDIRIIRAELSEKLTNIVRLPSIKGLKRSTGTASNSQPLCGL